MSDKRFSNDFSQKTGDTPLNFRVLVEDPASGTEYWVTNEQAQAILKAELDAESLARSEADALKLNASAIADLTRTNNMGKILSDVSFSAPWLDGFIVDNMSVTEDGEFYIIKKINHGFNNTEVIEFNHNNGSLPDGIVAYNAQYADSAVYYNVCNVTPDSFQITAVPGSSTPNSFTSLGVGSWQLRRAITGAMISIPVLFNNENYIELDIIANYGALKQNPGLSYLMLNGNGNYFCLGSRYAIAMFIEDNGVSYSKYTTINIKVRIKKLSASYCQVDVISNRFSTSNFSTYDTSNAVRTFKVFTTDNIAAIYIGSNDATNMQYRSIRAFVIQQ